MVCKVNLLTFKGVWELLKKKIGGGYISEGNLKDVENYIENKQKLTEKPIGTFYSNVQYKSDLEQLKLATLYLKHLKKDDLNGFKLPSVIHPAGELMSGFGIEPIDKGEFVYNWLGQRGNAHVLIYDESKKAYIVIEGQEILLSNKAIKSFAFKLPNKDMVYSWIKGEINAPTTKELMEDLNSYFRTFSDLQEDSSYGCMVAYVFQSWMCDALKVVFYLAILGQWGGGKTTLGELISNVTKHGFHGTIPSAAFLARMIDSQKISIYIDELDSFKGSEDNFIFSIIRQGYRYGAKFPRVNPTTLEPEFFNIYGAKCFSIYSAVEGALLQRSIPITTTESTDKRLPLINTIKQEYGYKLYNSIFLWYLENSIYMVDVVSGVDYNIEREIYNRDSVMARVSIEGQPTQQVNLTGRNAELGFVMARIAKILGVQLVDLVDIEKTFEIKKQVEEERLEIGMIGILREHMVELFEKYRGNIDYITKDGWLKISNKETYNSFNDKLKKDKGLGVGPDKFQGLLRDLNFERPLSRKPMKIKLPNEFTTSTRLCNIFTAQVLKKLGLPIQPLQIQEPLKVEEEIIK